MNQRDAQRFTICSHEAGHAVVARAVGRCPYRVVIDGDGSGVTELEFQTREDAPTARANACIFYAGEIAQAMLVSPRLIALCGPKVRDLQSDEAALLNLAARFGGSDPLVWANAAKKRAQTILAIHYVALREAAMRLLLGKPLRWCDEPIIGIRANPIFSAPFAEPQPQTAKIHTRLMPPPQPQPVRRGLVRYAAGVTNCTLAGCRW